jgi:hypothetical protein
LHIGCPRWAVEWAESEEYRNVSVQVRPDRHERMVAVEEFL